MRPQNEGGRFHITVNDNRKSGYYNRETKTVGLFSGRMWYEWPAEDMEIARDKVRLFFETQDKLMEKTPA